MKYRKHELYLGEHSERVASYKTSEESVSKER